MSKYNPERERRYRKTEKGRAAHKRAMERYRAKNRERLLAYQREYDRAHYTHTPKAHEPVSCLFCGQAFTPSHGNQIYCSDSCTIRARNRRVRARDIASGKIQTFTKVCKWCGNEFQTTSGLKIYCSPICCRRACDHAHHEKTRRKAKATSANGGLTEGQMHLVEAAMAMPPTERFAASRSWTPAMRKYAQKIYMNHHGLFRRFVPDSI